MLMMKNMLKELILVLANRLEVNKSDVQVVWYSKTLQNAKMICFVGIPNGTIYELTYDGDKEEYYLDTYTKTKNEKYN